MQNGEVCQRKKLYKSGKILVTASIFAVMGFGTAISQANASSSDNDSKTQTISKIVKSKVEPATVQPAEPAKPAEPTNKIVDQADMHTVSGQNSVPPVVTNQSNQQAAKPTTPVTDVTDTHKIEANNVPADVMPANAPDKQSVTNAPVVPPKHDTDQQDDSLEKQQVLEPTINSNIPKKQTNQQLAVATAPANSAPQTKTTAEISAGTELDTVPNVKHVDGKVYFYGDDGQPKKNFTTIIDGKPYYFDKDTGALSNNDKQYVSELFSIGNKHNAVYNTSSDNFTQLEGHLTASSWYRPKDILKNGKRWVPSTVTDFRPLLMAWWPDKSTQVTYLNYMKDQGLLSGTHHFSDNENMRTLTAAAMQAQVNIEKKIGQLGNTDWLKTAMTQYIDAQPNWNIDSEAKGDDHLQGGALLYTNSDMSPKANSDYRKLSRTPKNQKGQIADKYKQGGFELLLANDVDNSNPVVQAEQLNWLHYMMNIGSILQNDDQANFDGYRVDAVDNVDADLLQIAGEYAKAAYGVDKNDARANQHLSILEDWGDEDPDYVKAHGNQQITMDFPLHLAIKYALNMPNDKRSGLEPTREHSLVKRITDDKENVAQPNYSFIRAHDSEVQTIIADIIKDKINPVSTGLDSTVTLDQIKQAFDIYNADELKADKVYTPYNIPASYALLLTNKDTIPRVYYGDMFTDDGQYMAKQSPYYQAIDALLKARIKYDAGGQTMKMNYFPDEQSVMTSVRYGKGAMTASDSGNQETRYQGIGLVVNNRPDLKLSDKDEVKMDMGAAHKNQDYRPVLLTTKSGLKVYSTDANAPVVRTDANGQLTFKADMVYGVNDPQVSGYIAAWVPVGASENQDARTKSETTQSTDGSVYHSNAALDSQVIYEGFSNFQDFPTTPDEFTNIKIAQNVNLFKDWGITSFEMAPQYRASSDKSFLDAIVQNGYAFTDRYDIGYNTPTKYGTADNLLDALRALHGQGIQAINDWVPDQIYNLPDEQLVTAIRTDGSGDHTYGSVIDHTLYASKTVGGGIYQQQYGGAFLDQLKTQYPQLFQQKQISTDQPMNPDIQIKSWEAKYFNGSNIQGRGAWYVLKDWGTQQYFNVSDAQTFLPKQLLGEKAKTGFVTRGKETSFYSTSGYQAKSAFICDNGNWYYFDDKGKMVVGNQVINGINYYFLPNGIELQDAYLVHDGMYYYYNNIGKQLHNTYFQDKQKNFHYFFEDGHMAQGIVTIIQSDGTPVTQYFDENGKQQKGVAVKGSDGHLHYFDGASGNMLFKSWGRLADGSWLYVDEKGNAVTGKQTINNQTVYFNDDGRQIKNNFKELADGSWIYLNNKGVAVTGEQIINGQTLYFGNDGRQFKGTTHINATGESRYYDPDSGNMITDRFERVGDNQWAYFGYDGVAVTGDRIIKGQKLYFNQNGIQMKGHLRLENGIMRYYDADTGELVRNRFVLLSDGSWVYFGQDGVPVTGVQVINGQTLYFDADGRQVKGQQRVIGNQRYWMDKDNGEMKKITY